MSDLHGESDLRCYFLITAAQVVILFVRYVRQTSDSFTMFSNSNEWNMSIFIQKHIIISICDLEQPGIPQGLGRQREKLLHSSSLLPHHKLLSGRGEVQGGDNVRVVRQLGPDGLTVQLLHAVYNKLPLTLRLGLLHWKCEEKKQISFAIVSQLVRR